MALVYFFAVKHTSDTDKQRWSC